MYLLFALPTCRIAQTMAFVEPVMDHWSVEVAYTYPLSLAEHSGFGVGIWIKNPMSRNPMPWLGCEPSSYQPYDRRLVHCANEAGHNLLVQWTVQASICLIQKPVLNRIDISVPTWLIKLDKLLIQHCQNQHIFGVPQGSGLGRFYCTIHLHELELTI